MKKWILVFVIAAFCFLGPVSAFAGDLTCYGYTSITSHFVCNISPYNSGNCVWWGAYKRPDIAAIISGSGWDGGQWYDKLSSLGFDVGQTPKVGAIAEFSSPGHVAYIESLGENGSFNVSEMDAYGRLGSGVVYGTYSPNGGTYKRNGSGSWTLKGFIYGATNLGGTTVTIQYRLVGNVAWNPPNRSCYYADRWIFYSGGYPNGAQSIGLNSICQQEESEMRDALGGYFFKDWWNVIYSPTDLTVTDGVCIQ